MKIDHRESNRSIDCNRWQLINCYWLVSGKRWPIDSHNNILPPSSIAIDWPPYWLFSDSSRRIVRSLSFCLGDIQFCRASFLHRGLFRDLGPENTLGKRAWPSAKRQEWYCQYPSLMGFCLPSIRHHQDNMVAYEIEASWWSVFQNRYQSMTIDGVHFIDCNRYKVTKSRIIDWSSISNINRLIAIDWHRFLAYRLPISLIEHARVKLSVFTHSSKGTRTLFKIEFRFFEILFTLSHDPTCCTNWQTKFVYNNMTEQQNSGDRFCQAVLSFDINTSRCHSGLHPGSISVSGFSPPSTALDPHLKMCIV